MIKNSKKLIALLFVFAMLQSNFAGAVVPHLPDLVQNGNLWRFTYYNDASPSHDTLFGEPICFDYEFTLGTHQRYRWYVQSNPSISGKASQEGDQITMMGDYFLGPIGIDISIMKAHQWELTTDEKKRSMGTGHHQIYLRQGDLQRSAHFNMFARRAGFCQSDIPQDDPTQIPSFEPDVEREVIEEVKDIVRKARRIQQI
ncbi:MAG: hypothetical protein HRT47_09290 [Candidatus Caenarcaniphilales bacterium]|nr:hypothetical protein [Candidatus Caenarcaniphilales bacterium]